MSGASSRTTTPQAIRKTKVAQEAKAEVGITALDWPGYSPDLNPLDFSLWAEVERRARAKVGDKSVSAKEYKQALRQTALRLPAGIVKKAVENMKVRINACYKANGGNIPRD